MTLSASISTVIFSVLKFHFFHVLGEKLGLLLHYGIEATHQLREGTEVHHLQGDTEDEEVGVLQVHL